DDQRRPQFQTIADAIPFARDAAIEILDVGAGYGALTQFLLEQFPNTTALCQEGSEEMAKLGRRRMAKWKDRFDYVIADFVSQAGARRFMETSMLSFQPSPFTMFVFLASSRPSIKKCF